MSIEINGQTFRTDTVHTEKYIRETYVNYKIVKV